MSAIPHQRGPHVKDLFGKAGPAVGVGSLHSDPVQESRTSYDLNSKKKGRAPAPPVNLGQYKPKILSASSDEANVPLSHNGSSADGRHEVRCQPGSPGQADGAGIQGKAIVMGDKDTPLVLPSARGTYDLEQDVRGLSMHSSNQGDGVVIGTSNPLFNVHAPKANGNDVSVNGESPVSNGKAPPPHYVKRKDQKKPEVLQNGEPEGVFIPPPDYDELEKTMVFSDEPEEDDDEGLSSELPGKKVYKEYQGEDFAQYLSDEDVVGQQDNSWGRHKKRAAHGPDRKAKTEVKRNHYKKRDSVGLGKGGGKKDKVFHGNNSLRNFSYADSKFGTINGGSSSSSRQGSMRSLIAGSTGEAELFVNTGSSYEQFLCSKSGDDLPHPTPLQAAVVPPVPSRFTGPAHRKDTLWKKLTWKFKKPKNELDLGS